MPSSYKRGDHYNKKARQAGMPARSVFKLEELDLRFHLLTKNDAILDLGAAPGSWTRYAAGRVGPSGSVHAVDLQPLAEFSLPGWVTFVQGDVVEMPIEQFPQPVQVVLSDMAPKTTGDRFGDAARSHELCLRVLEIACACLSPGGKVVFKVFEGEDTPALLSQTRQLFASVKPVRPKAVRSVSREIFVVALDRRGES